ncbi:MAG: hypothetical protein GXY16_07215 [Syntrophomonadaceae bacterium]|nr:hypothetical protein [Syntrophomonadaceae bacterium]
MEKPRRNYYHGLLTVFLAVVITITTASFILAQRDARIYPSNIVVGGINIGNLDKNQALERLQSSLFSSWGNHLQLLIDGKIISIPLALLGIEYNPVATIEKTDKYLTEEAAGNSILKSVIIRGKTRQISPVLSWQEELITTHLKQVKETYDRPAQEARFVIKAKNYEYIAEHLGLSIDLYASKDCLVKELEAGLLGPVELVYNKIEPRLTLDDIKNIKDVLAVAVITSYGNGNEMDDVLKHFNEQIILPDETIHINDILKINQAETLTNSQLKATNLVIKAAKQAGLIIDQDKLQITNHLKSAIAIAASREDNFICCQIIGESSNKTTKISLLREEEILPAKTAYVIDRKLSPEKQLLISKGTDGTVINMYKVESGQGKETARLLLAQDIKPAVDTILAVGPDRIKK